MRTLRYVVQLGLGIVLPLLIQRWDRRRLSPERRDRAWNTASWAAALYAFGPLSMLGWCWVTRQDAWLGAARAIVGRLRPRVALVIAFVISLVVGLLVGVMPVVLAIYLIDYVVGSALGLKVEPLW